MAKTREEEQTADQVAALFQKLRSEQKLPPLKRFKTSDTQYLCVPKWVKPYPAYEELRDWVGLETYETTEPEKATDALARLARLKDSKYTKIRRFSAEACATGRPGEFRIVAAVWESAWRTNLNRLPRCRRTDIGICWPWDLE